MVLRGLFEAEGGISGHHRRQVSFAILFPQVTGLMVPSFSGFDLVGWEDGLRPLSDYLPDLLWFKERQKEVGLDIPYLFHAGETLGDGSKADMVSVLPNRPFLFRSHRSHSIRICMMLSC